MSKRQRVTDKKLSKILIWRSSLYVRKLFLFWILLLLPCSFFSQTYDGNEINVLPVEKVYLQLTSKIFAKDQTIWFRAVVVESDTQTPSRLSGVLYVDLVDSNGHIVNHKLIKLNQGIGSGNFELSNEYNSERYQVRAYTQWNRNYYLYLYQR